LQVFDSTKGGRAKLDTERETRLGWPESKRATEDEKYAKQHHGQCWSCEPLLPFDIVQFDPMHGVHNELNVLLDEVKLGLAIAPSCKPREARARQKGSRVG
jgi:hypothetical protein